jgi:hypothetical protein
MRPISPQKLPALSSPRGIAGFRARGSVGSDQKKAENPAPWRFTAR